MKLHTVLFFFLFLGLLFSGCQQKNTLQEQPPLDTPPPSETPLVPTSLPSQSPSPLMTPKATMNATPKGSPSVQSGGKRISVSSLPSTFRSDDTRNITTVDTIIIHSLYNPTSSEPFTIQAAKAVLDQSEVSSHFVIDRAGKVYQLVPENYQAWHAGESTMPAPDGRKKVNTFSIGIELTGNETSGFTTSQYDSLAKLIADLMDKLPITTITGHSDIAVGRKTDPWKFEWASFESLLKKQTSKPFQILGSHS